MGNRSEAGSQKSKIRSRSGFRSQKSALRNNIRSAVLFSVFSFILSFEFCLLAPFSYAEQKKENVPTVITSESLTADNKAKTALFTGSVIAKKGDMTMYADRMLVYYSDSNNSGGSNIDKIEADGNVKLVKGDRIVTSGKAVYFAGPDERAIFTESPRAAEGKNVVTGTKMTYYMKDDRSVVENSKVFIVEKEQAEGGRSASTKKDDKGRDKKKK